jgi:hypothetical protein
MIRHAAAVLMMSAVAFTQEPGVVPAPDALPLPEAPKAEAKSEHKALQKDKSLILETKPDGTKRVLVAAEVCLREGPLEMFVCKKHSKEHESIMTMEVKAEFVHTALLAAGAKSGAPVQFVDPKTGEPDYKPASGAKIKISIYYVKNGKATTDKAQDWIMEAYTKKAMTHDFVFAGSRTVKNPDKPGDPAIYTADLGEVISVSNKRDAMLEIPVKSSDADSDLLFSANTEKIPPLGSKVWLILEPEAEKKDGKK